MNDLQNDQKLGRWPGEQERQPLVDALRELSSLAWRDCYGSEARDNDRQCSCETCIAKRAIEATEALLYPTVRSLTPERMANGTGFRERLFFEAWRDANKRRRHVNGGCGTLELLVQSLGPITQRDMDVATAVVQWLGTSCGGSFLDDVQKSIKRVQEEASRSRIERLESFHGRTTGFGTVETFETSGPSVDVTAEEQR